MDVVYILGTGSVWNNNEIRFSLRSIEKNISDLGNVFVVGERPPFLKNIIHIACKDPYPVHWKNAYFKTVRACRDSRLSENFLLLNDDFFIIEPIEAAAFPYYHNEKYPRMNNQNHAYFTAIEKARVARGERPGQAVFNFAVHRPIRYNKKRYLEMPIINESSLTFSPRSFYANYYSMPGVGCSDPIVYCYRSAKKYDEAVAGLTDFSILSSTAQDPIFQAWLKKRFPEPSRYE